MNENVKLLSSESSISSSEENTKKLSVVSLAALMFFLTCGGAYGMEDLGGTIPAPIALGLMLVLPWIWSFPTGMVVAELSLAFPSKSGFLEWYRLGLGNWYAFTSTYINMGTLLFDLALYPIIFSSYMTNILELSETSRFLLNICFILLAFMVVTIGGDFFARISEIITVVTILPFVAFFVCGFFSVWFDPNQWFNITAPEHHDEDWSLFGNLEMFEGWNLGLFLSVLIWGLSGYNYAGFLVSQAEKPHKFPSTLLVVIMGAQLTYFLPVLTSISQKSSGVVIQEGAYPLIAEAMGFGSWLKWMILIGGLGSTFGTYVAYIHTATRAFASQVKRGNTPAFFAIKLPVIKGLFGTYIVGNILVSIAIGILTTQEFEIIVEIESALIVFDAILMFITYIALKIKKKDVPRPFALAKNPPAAVALVTCPILIGLLNLSFVEPIAIAVAAGIIVGAILLYNIIRLCRLNEKSRDKPKNTFIKQ